METLLHNFSHKKQQFSRRVKPFLVGLSGGSLVFIFLNLFLLILPNDRLAFGTRVGGTLVGGKTHADALLIARRHHPEPEPFTFTLVIKDTPYTIQSTELGYHSTLEAALAAALRASHTGTLFDRWLFRVAALTGGQDFSIRTLFDEALVQTVLQSLARQEDDPGVRPQAFVRGAYYTIEEGRAGLLLQQADTAELIHNQAAPGASLAAILEPVNPPLTADGMIHTRKRLDVLRNASLEIEGDIPDRPLTLTAVDFFPWLTLPEGFQRDLLASGAAQIASRYDRAGQNAEWELDESGKKLKKFVPHRPGRVVNPEWLQQELMEQLVALQDGEAKTPTRIRLEFQESNPDITLGDLNSLGITERIGVGTSLYAHSIPNRIFNVGLTSSRLNFTLVQPGEEFSFNRAVGEVSGKTGYKAAYVIKDGMTQLGDGGGVCQVSTTIFRAALNAGLPITAWKAHSYRVSYYEQNSQPGYDATVYAPSTDFRFRNDTPGAIVVTSQADSENQFLVVELWGTSDGRKSELSNYSISNQRPAPAPRYQDDPTLPRGRVKQVDWSAPGATTKFTYTVKNADGTEKFSKNFVSNFRPWQAVFLVGTKD